MRPVHAEAGTRHLVEPDLHQYASDILWSVKTTGGEDGYVYTLIEHQSTENLYMPFRMLRYSVAAMQRHLEQHKTLPLVIPVLFYHGERSPYPYSMNWLDCFENPALAAKIYTKPFPLVDITVVDDNEIMSPSPDGRTDAADEAYPPS